MAPDNRGVEGALRELTGEVHAKLVGLDEKLDGLKEQVDEKLDGLKEQVDEKMDDLSNQITAVRTEQQNMTQRRLAFEEWSKIVREELADLRPLKSQISNMHAQRRVVIAILLGSLTLLSWVGEPVRDWIFLHLISGKGP